MMERVRSFQPKPCPTCRGHWIDRSRPDIERLEFEQELDAQSVQVSLSWLYSGIINIDALMSRTNDKFNLASLQCWEVSDDMDD